MWNDPFKLYTISTANWFSIKEKYRTGIEKLSSEIQMHKIQFSFASGSCWMCIVHWHWYRSVMWHLFIYFRYLPIFLPSKNLCTIFYTTIRMSVYFSAFSSYFRSFDCNVYVVSTIVTLDAITLYLSLLQVYCRSSC